MDLLYRPEKGITEPLQQPVVRRLLQAGILRRAAADDPAVANMPSILERAKRLGSIVYAPGEGFTTAAVREAERRLIEHDEQAVERRLDAALAPFLKDEA